ncbi:hypothetical protein GR158_15860 [Shinella sp. AETb1-6]|uniref:hypothetical protein n=1 Tax=Shinella sp. AETb1-6 TaxID=2692210 RepID=UPI001368B63E|nr:hypothetical protein [Shinella sp. AETb1-6]MXN52599.1 hypothetical protein [Shinella sp. AETb1-6]
MIASLAALRKLRVVLILIKNIVFSCAYGSNQRAKIVKACDKLTDHVLLHKRRSAAFATRLATRIVPPRLEGRPARMPGVQIQPSKNAGNRLYDGQRRLHGPH